MSEYEPYTPKPPVKRRCKRCEAGLRAQGLKSAGVVISRSGNGIEHEQAFDDAATLCGIQADGPEWWWEA